MRHSSRSRVATPSLNPTRGTVLLKRTFAGSNPYGRLFLDLLQRGPFLAAGSNRFIDEK
jgi:hypothetical protein